MKRKKIKAMLSITFGVLGAFLIGLGVDTLTFTPITIGFCINNYNNMVSWICYR